MDTTRVEPYMYYSTFFYRLSNPHISSDREYNEMLRKASVLYYQSIVPYSYEEPAGTHNKKVERHFFAAGELLKNKWRQNLN
jgi:hypothetical protein